MIDDDATALPGFDDVHGADHTTRSTPGRPSRLDLRKNVDRGCGPPEHDLERGDRWHRPPSFHGRHVGRVNGAPNAAWSGLALRCRRSSSPSVRRHSGVVADD
jgi:hypothetical protein